MPIGYKKQPVKADISDVTGSRAVDGTIYQNTTGRPILVIVAVACIRTAVPAAQAYVFSYVEGVTPPTVLQSVCGLAISDNNLELVYGNAVFAVPNGHYYRLVPNIAGAGATITLNSWIEVTL